MDTGHEDRSDRVSFRVANRRQSRRCRLSILSVAFLVMVAASVHADLTTVGSLSRPSGSYWEQRFDSGGIDTFDFIAIVRTGGSSFETPGFDDFPDSSWSAVSSPSLANAWGDPADPLDFDILFTANPPAAFNLYVWSGQLFVEGASVAYIGGEWTIHSLAFSDENPPPYRNEYTIVPAPAAALLGVIGLGLVGWLARRFL